MTRANARFPQSSPDATRPLWNDEPMTEHGRHDQMQRIVVLGCGGSGKTYLSNRLARELDLAVTHLDAIYYDADWKPLAKEAFAVRQESLVASSRWLIEGNYASTLHIRLDRADTVIFLDLPAWACLIGILQRRWRYRGGQHDKSGVYDRITWDFLRYVLRYRATMRPRVRRSLAEHGAAARLVTLSSRRQADRFLKGIRANMRSSDC
jgi:adenylate kinase family enzyme